VVIAPRLVFSQLPFFLTKIGTNSKLDTVIADLQSLEILSKNQKQLEIVLHQLEGPIIRSASMLQDYKDSMQGNVSFKIIHRSKVYIPNYLPFPDVFRLGKADKVEREREELLQWLSAVSYQKHHKSKRNEYLEGSCGWLLSSREFVEWKKSSISSILWLRGTGRSEVCDFPKPC
jgi:hypothetical protein